MGTSPNNLSLGNSFLRQRRIYDASELTGGKVRKPYRPWLKPGVWSMVTERHEGHLADVRECFENYPSVFTKRQLFVVGALFFMWDTQGADAMVTYDDILRVIPYICVDGDSVPSVSIETVGFVLHILEEAGAVKYIRGFQGVKSQLHLVHMSHLSHLPRRSAHAVTYPTLRTGTPLAQPAPSPGTQPSGFGYWSLLREMYMTHPTGKVTRTFNQELKKVGLCGRQVKEWLPKLHYPTLTWYVSCEPADDWKLQVAINETKRRLS